MGEKRWKEFPFFFFFSLPSIMSRSQNVAENTIVYDAKFVG